MGLADAVAGSKLTPVDFRRAFADVEVTPDRVKTLQAYARAREAITAPELSIILETKSGRPVNRGNIANYNIASAVARALQLESGDKWFLGCLFDSCEDEWNGHTRFRLYPAAVEALSNGAGPWTEVWRKACLMPPFKIRSSSPLDQPVALRKRMAWDRRPAFRRAVLKAWTARCALSGTQTAAAIEAAHIDRYSESQDDSPGNGLALRADLHRLFDARLLCFLEGVAQVHPRVKDPLYRRLQGKRLQPPDDPQWQPKPTALLEHRALALEDRDGW